MTSWVPQPEIPTKGKGWQRVLISRTNSEKRSREVLNELLRQNAKTCTGKVVMHLMKITSKPYEGKAFLQFDERVLKVK